MAKTDDGIELSGAVAEISLGDLARTAIKRAHAVLTQESPTAADVKLAQVAMSAVSAWTRARQTEGARPALNFAIARELAGDSRSHFWSLTTGGRLTISAARWKRLACWSASARGGQSTGGLSSRGGALRRPADWSQPRRSIRREARQGY